MSHTFSVIIMKKFDIYVSDKHNADVASVLKAELSEEYGSNYSDAVIQSMLLFLS